MVKLPARKEKVPQIPEDLKHPPTGEQHASGVKVLERYPLETPFSFGEILQAHDSAARSYYVDEIRLSQTEVAAYNYLLGAMENELIIPRKKVDPKVYFQMEARKIARKYSIALPRVAWSKILYYAERDIAGFGVLDGLMRDPNIEDISVDGINNPVLVYHRKYERIPTNIIFDDETVLNDLIAKFAHVAGKHISVAFPIMQGILPGGHRVMATFRKEVSPHGGTMSIRKFREDPITVVDMLDFGVLDPMAAAYVWLLMENKSTAIIVGATGGGKTTTMNAFLTLTPVNSKIVTIEEVQELNLPHKGWTALVSREAYGVTEEGPKGVNLFDLVKAAMRMRPDILVVGEVRGEEAYVLFQAISTGHGGLCLPPWEHLPVIINGTNSLMTMNELFEKEWDEMNVTRNDHSEISTPKDEVLVPSFDVASNMMQYSRVKRISKRKYRGKLLTFKGTGGNSGTVTTDHPMLVLRQGKVVRATAKELRIGDLLAVVDEMPTSLSMPSLKEIDLIEELAKAGLQKKIVVKNVKDLVYAATKGQLGKMLGVVPRAIDDYREKDYLPLERYLMLKDSDRRRRFLRFRKSPHQLPAVIQLNKTFARLLGFYLAEGHASKVRVDFSFNREETDFAREVRNALSSCFGLRSSLRESGPEAIQVIVKDRLLSTIFTEILKAGHDSYTKKVPAIVQRMDKRDVKDLLDAYFQGDGSPFVGKDGRAVFQATTASDDLAYGVYYLMLGIGYHLNIGMDKRYGNLELIVAGGENFRRFAENFKAGKDLRGAIYKGNPGAAEKVPIEYVVKRTPHQLLYTKMADGNRFVSKQVLDRLGLSRPNGIYFSPIRLISERDYDGYVYDLFEVEGSHTFVHGFGVVSSNCTLHADDTASAIQRLVSKPMDVPEAFIPFLDLAITVRRFNLPLDGGGSKAVRRIVSIDEVYGAGDFKSVFTWDPASDKLVRSPLRESKKLTKLAKGLGLTLDQVEAEIKRRSVVLQWMHRKGYRNFKEITPLFQAYSDDPSGTYERAKIELDLPAPMPPRSWELKA